ncbi:hypothetical protein Nepgr_023853 [Nepenthes gracilis]|uniref:Clathrin/coatomer adaptor adaptin-like N-terminal domain-containing protein n=1 Tax=Nepenthes gracilis TaxID=150966 RepID=A0AAD3T248_NEPGR|nr:hypothetical protein Nepgr_023853 [Nepenthes gracilis]
MEKTCTLLVFFDEGTPALANEIKEALEGNDVQAKIDAMKKAIVLLLNDETIPQLLITIVRYVLPSEDHTIQKLLLLYLEIIEKTDPRGKTEIIKPLISSVLTNLEHRHPFVRRNTILAVRAIYKLPQGEHLSGDAPETIEKVVSTEQDPLAERNAFLTLFICAQDKAVNYLFTHTDRISDWSEQLQMVVLQLIRKVCRTNRAPTAIRVVATTYCQLLLSQSDNNVELIVLDRLNELKTSHREIMVEMIMDVFRTLSSPNLDIRRKALDVALELITPRNSDEVVLLL